jgi:hypothetical protein
MSLAINNPQGASWTIAEIKKELIMEFQRPKLEDHFMNDMIWVRKKLGESVWDIDQRFKKFKGKLKYPIYDM